MLGSNCSPSETVRGAEEGDQEVGGWEWGCRGHCQSFQNPGQQGLRNLCWGRVEGLPGLCTPSPAQGCLCESFPPGPTGNGRAQPLNESIQTPAFWKVPLLPAALPLRPREPGQAGLLRGHWRQGAQWLGPASHFSSCLVIALTLAILQKVYIHL